MREKRASEREREQPAVRLETSHHTVHVLGRTHTRLFLLLAVHEFKLSAAHSTSRTGGEGPCCCETYRMAPLKVPFAGR